MGTAVALVLAALFILIVGTRTLSRGWRGRLVGDRPYCRRCGFDLSNRQLTGRCPECGVDIEARREVIVGVRHRRWIVLGLGLILTTLSAMPMWIVITGQYKDFDWLARKPVFWLLHEATTGDPPTQTAALGELAERMSFKKLSVKEVDSIIERGLLIQRDTRRTWNTAWGDWIEAARDAGYVNNDQWKRYAQQAVTTQWLAFATRQRAHQNDMVMGRLTAGTARVGHTPRLMCELRELGLMVDQKEYPPPAKGGFKAMSLDALNRGISVSAGSDAMSVALSMLGPGEHSGYLRVQATVMEAIDAQAVPVNAPTVGALNPYNPFGSPAPNIDPRAVQQWMETTNDPQIAQAIVGAQLSQRRTLEESEVALKAIIDAGNGDRAAAANKISGAPTGADVELHLPVKLEVVERGAAVAVGVRDESLRPRVQRALNVFNVTVADGSAELQVQCYNPPMDLSYKVSLRQGDREWAVGSVAFKAHQASIPPTILGQLHGDDVPDGASVDVVFRPDGGNAGATLGIEKYWEGTLTLAGVPLRDPQGPERRRRRDAAAIGAMRRYADRIDHPLTTPTTVATVAAPIDPAMLDSIARIRSIQSEIRDKLLAIPKDLQTRYANFLLQENTGIFKLMARGKYEDAVVGLSEGGSCYSFTKKSHATAAEREIQLDDGRFSCGTVESSYGYFLPLGDVWIEDLLGATSVTPKWASGEIGNEWAAMWREAPIDGRQVRTADQLAVLRSNGRMRPGVSATPGNSYLLRTVSFGADALVALQVVRKFDDGSVVIVYRVLKRFEHPAR